MSLMGQKFLSDDEEQVLIRHTLVTTGSSSQNYCMLVKQLYLLTILLQLKRCCFSTHSTIRVTSVKSILNSVCSHRQQFSIGKVSTN